MKLDYQKAIEECRRLRPEAELAKSAEEQNEHLRHEITRVYEHLRRVDPQGQHVFGQMTDSLARRDAAPMSQTTLPSLRALAPVQQQQGQWMPNAAAPVQQMQGVEYSAPGTAR